MKMQIIMYLTIFAFVLVLFATKIKCSYVEGFSFHKFVGPVSGQIYSVPVKNVHQNHGGETSQKGRQEYSNSVDFIAKPDYIYAYGVEDPYTGNQQAHMESRDGNVVSGEYSIVQPDGVIRIVKYTADPENGFRATVHYRRGQSNTNESNE